MKTICPYCGHKVDLPKWKYFTAATGQKMKYRRIGKKVYFEGIFKGTKKILYKLPWND